SGEHGEEDPVTAEDLVLDPLDRRDRELHRVLEQSDVGRMYPQALTGLQVVGDDLAAEEPGSEALLEADGELHAADAAHEGVTVSQIAHARLRSNVDWEDH